MATTTQNYYGNMNVVETAKEDERSRNLQRARVASNQKIQQKESVNNMPKTSVQADTGTTKVNTGVSMQNQSQAQKKSQLRKMQGIYKKKRGAKKKKKLLMRRYTRQINRYQKAPWMLMYGAVAGNVIGGLLTEFGIGYLFVIPSTLFIDVMVWRAVSKKDRLKVRKLIILSTGIKFIPFISMMPASLYLVYYSKKMAKKRHDSAQKKMKKLNEI